MAIDQALINALEKALGSEWTQVPKDPPTEDAVMFRHADTGTAVEVEVTRTRERGGGVRRPWYRGFMIHAIEDREDIPWEASQVDSARFRGNGWKWRLALDAAQAAKAEVAQVLIQRSRKPNGR